MTWLTLWIGGVGAIAASVSGCAHNASRFHTELPPKDFDQAVTSTFPQRMPRSELLETCRREHLSVKRLPSTADDVPLKVPIYPKGTYATWGYSGTTWGELQFAFDQDDRLKVVRYMPPWTHERDKREIRPLAWPEEPK